MAAHSLPLRCCFICCLNFPPKTAQHRAAMAAVSCWPHFCSKRFGLFNKYFLTWMQKSSFLTSIAYTLTPSIINLVGAIATASKQLFTMRSLHIWGRSFASFYTEISFVTDPLIGQERQEISLQPIKRQVSYDDDMTAVYAAVSQSQQLTEKCGKMVSQSWVSKSIIIYLEVAALAAHG